MAAKGATTSVDWAAGDMVKTWQFYALILLFCLNTQAGLLIIGHGRQVHQAHVGLGLHPGVSRWGFERPRPCRHRQVLGCHRQGQGLYTECRSGCSLHVRAALGDRDEVALPGVPVLHDSLLGYTEAVSP